MCEFRQPLIDCYRLDRNRAMASKDHLVFYYPFFKDVFLENICVPPKSSFKEKFR